MRSLIAGLIFFCLAPLAHAEYYVICNEPALNTVTINCRGHHCHYSTKQAGNYQRANPYVVRNVARPHRVSSPYFGHKIPKHYRNVKYCNLDRATGDDNPCRDPDLQIN